MAQNPQKEYKLAKGYDIRVQREGSDSRREKQWACGVDGALPREWEELKQDPTVVSARICPGYQRNWWEQKRTVLDQYDRPSS